MKVFAVEIRVRYKETDNMGVVYYSNYLVWFEVARTEYLRSLGISYRDIEKRGAYLMVASASCKYLRPARYDDIVKIETWVSEVKNSSLTFEYKLFVEGRPIATGESRHVLTDKNGRPRRIPEELKAIFTKGFTEDVKVTSSS
jgi:acyl-CoA thioester hydrolase